MPLIEVVDEALRKLGQSIQDDSPGSTPCSRLKGAMEAQPKVSFTPRVTKSIAPIGLISVRAVCTLSTIAAAFFPDRPRFSFVGPVQRRANLAGTLKNYAARMRNGSTAPVFVRVRFIP